jgi:hypothetical protein
MYKDRLLIYDNLIAQIPISEKYKLPYICKQSSSFLSVNRESKYWARKSVYGNNGDAQTSRI